MSEPILVLINGFPCTGKTTLAVRLANSLSLPLVTKDGIKELLFDSIGYSDRPWSQRLGVASFEILYYFIEVGLKAGKSLIAEGNFKAEFAGPRLQRLTQTYACRTIQIVCQTEPRVLVERYARRIESLERHPGHLDRQIEADFAAHVASGDWAPVPIACELLSVDTTTFDAIDYDRLVSQIRSILIS